MEELERDYYRNPGFLEVEVEYDFCTVCGEVVDTNELSDVAEYCVCGKCKEELKDTIYRMITKYEQEHPHMRGARTNYQIAEDLLLETVATEF